MPLLLPADTCKLRPPSTCRVDRVEQAAQPVRHHQALVKSRESQERGMHLEDKEALPSPVNVVE